ncbi:hypothetical protein EON66_00005 [archaeon]|nr:MAG: hypothetical protein EON66_00005 [archaeon]
MQSLRIHARLAVVYIFCLLANGQPLQQRVAQPVVGTIVEPDERAAASLVSCYNGTYRMEAPHLALRASMLLREHAGCTGFYFCEPGFRCTAAGERIACEPGTFSSTYGGTQCASCRAGYRCQQYMDLKFGVLRGATSATQLPCASDASSYCLPGTSVAMRAAAGHYTFPSTSNLTASRAQHQEGQRPCELGHFCVAGVRYRCPRGTYGAAARLTTPTCSGFCSSAAACPPGSLQFDEWSLEQRASDYCSAGSMLPEPPSARALAFNDAFTLAMPEPQPTPLRALQQGRQMPALAAELAQCPRGCYCLPDGTRVPCPGGRAGTRLGELDSACAAPCAAGYYCPRGSYSEHATACGAPALYCPPGSAVPRVVPEGYMPIGGHELTRSDIRPCEAGQYCTGAHASPCPAGTWGGAHALSSVACSGPCPRGFTCPAASVQPFSSACGNASVWCPLASHVVQPVQPGFFSVRWQVLRRAPPALDSSHATKTTTTLLTVCFPDGTPSPVNVEPTLQRLATEPMALSAPGAAWALTQNEVLRTFSVVQPNEADICQLAKRIAAADGELARAVQQRNISQELGVTATLVSDALRHASSTYLYVVASWSSDTQHVRDAQLPCFAGHYCEFGIMRPCPGGSYAATWGNTHAQCVACPPGYFCPQGSAAPLPCGSAAVYCPGWGNALPRLADAGYYTVAHGAAGDYIIASHLFLEQRVYVNDTLRDADADTRTHQLVCPPGTYCRAGIAAACYSGTYTSRSGVTSSKCDGPCAAGHYCTAGSVTPRQAVCGNATYYCPQGCAQPLRLVYVPL